MTGSSRRRGLRRGRIAVAGAVAATAVMAFGVSSAQAAPQDVRFTFDDAILSLPDPAGNSDILENPPDLATMDGTVDGTALNVAAVDFFFPPFSGSLSGIPLDVEFSAVDAITGTADTATGAVTTNPSTFETVVALGAPINSDCTYNSDESFKTGAGTSFNGDAFAVDTGVDPIEFTDGVLQTSWGASHFALVANTGDCSLVTNIINSGCGGLAIANNLVPQPLTCTPPPGNPPAATPPTAKKKAKCKKKKGKKSAQVAKKKCKKKKK